MGSFNPVMGGFFVAIFNFLARGGDGYPFRGREFTPLGVSERQALARYLEEVLDGEITAAMYPAGGEGRNTRLNNTGAVPAGDH